MLNLQIWVENEDGGEFVLNPEPLALWLGDWQRAWATLADGSRVFAEWEVSNPAVGTLYEGRDPNGRELRNPEGVFFEALAPGAVTITASYEGATARLDLTVNGWEVVAERSFWDRPDEVSGPQVHAVYVLASDGVDENLDRHGRIAWSLNATTDWLTYKLGRRLRVDTYNGEPDVTFLRLEQSESEFLPGRKVASRPVQEAIENSTWFSEEKTYAVYYSGPMDEAGGKGTLGPGPGFARAFSDRRRISRPTFFVTREPGVFGNLENTMAHELFHTMGAVLPECATNPGDRFHVDDDDNDLMQCCGTRRRGWNITEIDVGRDDYYLHGIPRCVDTADSPLWMDPPEAIPASHRPHVTIHPSALLPIVCLNH